MNISHQLFDYKINFVNSQREKTNSKDDIHSKTGLKCSVLIFLVYKNKSESKINIKIFYKQGQKVRIKGNYEKKLSQEIISRNYHRKL